MPARFAGKPTLKESPKNRTLESVAVFISIIGRVAAFAQACLMRKAMRVDQRAWVRDEFSEVIVVTFFELVFNNDSPTVFVFRNQINTEIARRSLSFRSRQVEIKGFIQYVDVVLKPLCNILRLVLPHFTQGHAL
jgi:hypothetical protein